MTNVMTGKPLVVDTHPKAPPILKLPRSQVSAVRQLLDQHDINYEVSEWWFSWDGEPEVGKINFGWKGDPGAVQAILDAAP